MTDETRTEVVSIVGPLAAPPAWAVRQAVDAALMSPCQKRRVGIAIYACERLLEVDTEDTENAREFVRELPAASGHNGPPWWPSWTIDELGETPATYSRPLCDGSAACRRDCSRRCVHAEARALDAILPTLFHRAGLLRLVHVEIDEGGQVVMCDGPSCGECSKMILDRGVGGIWLYERQMQDIHAREVTGQGAVVITAGARWRYYPAREFHDATCERLRIYQVPR
jgi:deoxycytidylate deaminase